MNAIRVYLRSSAAIDSDVFQQACSRLSGGSHRAEAYITKATMLFNLNALVCGAGWHPVADWKSAFC